MSEDVDTDVEQTTVPDQKTEVRRQKTEDRRQRLSRRKFHINSAITAARYALSI